MKSLIQFNLIFFLCLTEEDIIVRVRPQYRTWPGLHEDEVKAPPQVLEWEASNQTILKCFQSVTPTVPGSNYLGHCENVETLNVSPGHIKVFACFKCNTFYIKYDSILYQWGCRGGNWNYFHPAQSKRGLGSRQGIGVSHNCLHFFILIYNFTTFTAQL